MKIIRSFAKKKKKKKNLQIFLLHEKLIKIDLYPTGDLMNEDQLLGWLLHQKKHTEIPEVTDEMMDKLIETSPYLAVLFCKRSIRLSTSF